MNSPRYVKTSSVAREHQDSPPPSLLSRVKRRLTRKKTLKKPKNDPHRRKSSARYPARRPTATAAWNDVVRMTKDMPSEDALPPQRRVTIDMLPENTLLEIFDFYLGDSESLDLTLTTSGWHTLAHVCQKWRKAILSSPDRLKLQLLCTPTTLVQRMLDVWPPLPIVINHFGLTASEWGMHNIITALENNDRVRQIALKPIPGRQWENFMAAMSRPFPALTHLRLKSEDDQETPSDAPHSFLGGCTPNLRFLWLEHIPFPGLPNLLLSATDLVDLRLWEIPHSGYISPEAMASCLSALTRLERLDLEFDSPESRPDLESQRPRSSTRLVLPALTRFWFRGASEYLDDLAARIDAPLLQGFFIGFFHQLTFDTPHLAQFISRTPEFRLHNRSQMLCFSDWGASVIFLRAGTFERVLQLGVLCGQSDWQLSALAQLCTTSIPHALVEDLSVLEESLSPPGWQDRVEDTLWLELLHPFTAVKNLYLSKELAPRIAASLQGLADGRKATEALPALQKLFLEEIRPSKLVKKAIGKFVAARRRSKHPITISQWVRKG